MKAREHRVDRPEARVKERPILFSLESVRAILAGTKTQTRRVVTGFEIRGPHPPGLFDVYRLNGPGAGWCAAFKLGDSARSGAATLCPYGVPGDRLWVRETWRIADDTAEMVHAESPASVHYRADPDEVAGGPWRSPYHMFHWASRLTLEVAEVRVQRLQRVGSEDEPEVVLVLDGPGGYHHVRKHGAETVEVQRRVGDSAALEDVPRPAEFLSGIFDAAGANPVKFLMASDKDRARLLLEALPLKMDRVEFLRVINMDAKELPPVPTGLHPLEEIGLHRDAIFRTRTGVNRDQKSAAQAADQLRRNTPAVLPEDPAPTIAALDADIQALARDLGSQETAAKADHEAAVEKMTTAYREAETDIKAKFQAGAKDLRTKHDAYAAARRAEAEREIAAKGEQVQVEINARKEADEARLDELDATREAGVAAAHAAMTAATAGIAALRNTLGSKREQLSVLRQQAETAAQARGLAKQTKEFDDQAEKLKAEGERLTASIDALDVFARALAESLPIDGLSIEGKEIRRHGILYEQLNKQQQVEIAAEVSAIRAALNPLKMLFLDDLERLDTEHRTALIERLVALGLQPIGAVVTDGKAEVTYIGAVTAAAGA